MASVNFEKYKTTQKVKSVMRHCDKIERLKTKSHSNENINPEETKNNTQLYQTYQETCLRFDKRMEWLEKQPNKNKRSDKVICLGLEIPAPLDLPEEDFSDWSESVLSIVEQQYGKDNVMNSYCHVDEVHDYETKGGTVTSRRHLHILVVPEQNGRLNARDVNSRKRMIKLNNAIQDMSVDDYGVDFMNGTKNSSQDSVEALKQRSKLYSEIKELKELKKDLQDEITLYKAKNRASKNSKEIIDKMSDTQARLEKARREKAEELKRRAEERGRQAYEVLNKPEDYVDAEEQSDEEYT